MNGPMVTSVDAVRWAIADQIRELGGNEQVIDDVAIAAAYAVWCMPAGRPGEFHRTHRGFGGTGSRFAYD